MSPAGTANRYVAMAIQPARSRGSEYLTDGQILLDFLDHSPERFGPLFELFFAILQVFLKLFLLGLTQRRHIDIIADEFTHCSPLRSRDVESLSDDRKCMQTKIKSTTSAKLITWKLLLRHPFKSF